jgi:hypothetical protein
MNDTDDLSDSTASAHMPQAGTGTSVTAPPAGVLPAAVRSAVASLTELDSVALTEHIERYQQVHAGLQDALSGIEGV